MAMIMAMIIRMTEEMILDSIPAETVEDPEIKTVRLGLKFGNKMS